MKPSLPRWLLGLLGQDDPEVVDFLTARSTELARMKVCVSVLACLRPGLLFPPGEPGFFISGWLKFRRKDDSAHSGGKIKVICKTKGKERANKILSLVSTKENR